MNNTTTENKLKTLFPGVGIMTDSEREAQYIEELKELGMYEDVQED